MNLRTADRRELEAAHGPDIGPVIDRALAASVDAWAATASGRLLALFGVAPIDLLAGLGAPWLLGTDGLDRRARDLVRIGRAYVAAVRDSFPCLVNFVDARNAASIRWLQRIGFSVAAEPQPLGRNGEAFRRFWLGDCEHVLAADGAGDAGSRSRR